MRGGRPYVPESKGNPRLAGNPNADDRLMSVNIEVPTTTPTLSCSPVNTHRLLSRLASGSAQNVRFGDLQRLVEALGFRLQRVSGSHHIFSHPDIPKVLSLQQVRREAKPYQIRQLLRLVERYNLKLEDEP